MTETFTSNITRLMATDRGRHQMATLLHNMIEEVQALAAAAIEPDQPEAPTTTPTCTCEICTEASTESEQLRASVQAEN